MSGIGFKVGVVTTKNRLVGLDKAMGYAIAGGLNDGGRKVFTVLRRQLRAQIGAKKYATITSRTWALSASPGNLQYVIRAKNEPIDIVEFGAKLKGDGVSASPWGVSRVFARSFQQKKRAGAGNSGGFMARLSDKRYPVRALHGPNLARELLGLTPRSRTPEEFMRAARQFVPPALLARLERAFGG